MNDKEQSVSFLACVDEVVEDTKKDTEKLSLENISQLQSSYQFQLTYPIPIPINAITKAIIISF